MSSEYWYTGEFCPVVSCATFSSLRHRKLEVSAWLDGEFVAELDSTIVTDAAALKDWNAILVGKIRLLELNFGTTVSWMGVCASQASMTGKPYHYCLETLADYYASLADFDSMAIGCMDCRNGKTYNCLRDSYMCLDWCFPRRGHEYNPQPDFAALSLPQLRAWSFHVSVVSVAVIAFYVNNSRTLTWCRKLLSSSYLCVESTLGVGGLCVDNWRDQPPGSGQGKQGTPPPPYSP